MYLITLGLYQKPLDWIVLDGCFIQTTPMTCFLTEGLVSALAAKRQGQQAGPPAVRSKHDELEGASEAEGRSLEEAVHEFPNELFVCWTCRWFQSAGDGGGFSALEPNVVQMKTCAQSS